MKICVKKLSVNVLLNSLREELESYLVVSFQYFVFLFKSVFREWEASNDFWEVKNYTKGTADRPILIIKLKLKRVVMAI